jgi:lysozyme family protein
MRLQDQLRSEYQRLFDTAEVDPQMGVGEILSDLRDHEKEYVRVAEAVAPAMPWIVVGLIHQMESSGRFTRHLHNGDPLTAKTKNVPRGRPTTGQAPFTWEASAIDALGDRRLSQRSDWSIPGVLWVLEGYNGWGYREHHAEVLSPYLWSATNHYTEGKYAADGKFSKTLVSKQVGAAAILKDAILTGIVGNVPDFTGRDEVAAANLRATEGRGAVVRYGEKPYALEWQSFLNTFPGIQLSVDGDLGNKSSVATKHVTGRLLEGDPRG